MLPNRIAERDLTETIPEGTLAHARACRYFLAENAKSARAYLKALEHPVPIAELTIVEIGHEPDPARFAEWIAPIVNGQNGCIVSESGCPGVADPGAGLVAYATERGINVKPLVGPCSILLTLMASGMNGQRFRFLGYLPIDDAERLDAVRRLEEASREPETQLFIETPYRNNRLLSALAEHLAPETRITVATDVTGNDECIRTKTAAQWRQTELDLPKLPTVFAVLASGKSARKTVAKKPQVASPVKHGPTRRPNKSRSR
jgi:16S rRNA (cytidine1402-2'-O)-methyltransferase